MPGVTEESHRRPNFLVIVADDLGFSDCSCFGSEIQTPNIDSLSKDGIRFTEFHVAAACSPTRSMLMTGTDHHIAGLGQLQEFTRMSPAHRGQLGHEGYLNESVVALPELLRDGGYHTLLSGKWHLGLKPEHHPQQRGFDKSFALLSGCANHYAWEPKYDDPEHEPLPFLETATRALHVEDDHFVKDLPEDWYSSDGYTDKLLEYLKERTSEEQEKPFFAYLPYSAPHWPLQAPDESTKKYKDMYHDGPDALRGRRLQELKKLGLVDPEVKAFPKDPHLWDEIDEDIRRKSSKAMEVYAGMVDRMDWNIGRVVDYLKRSGEYDNTMVLFMSDNGAEGASYEAIPILGDEITSHLNKYYNNSLEKMAALIHSFEGGCRVPLVVKPPKTNDVRLEQSDGLITGSFCTVMDIVPTMLQLAGLKHPQQYKGRSVASLRGTSWVPFLETAQKSPETIRAIHIHKADYAVGFEIAGSGALRRGNHKITYVPAPRGPQRWELFDIKADPGEANDLSQSQPELMAEMLSLWEDYKKDVGVVGLAGEYSLGSPGERLHVDEFSDPYAWIKYVGRPDITPSRLQGAIPENVR